jgi:hypothetical protein
MRLEKLCQSPYKYSGGIIHWNYYGLTESPLRSQLFCSIYKLSNSFSSKIEYR